MDALPWLSCQISPGGNKLDCYEPPLYSSDPDLDDGCRPSIITLIGKRSKTVLLETMLDNNNCLPVHKDVHLWSSARFRSNNAPLLVVDCGVLTSTTQLNHSRVPTASWTFPKTQNMNTTLYEQILSPFSGVICYFVSDLGGLKATARWLAEHAVSQRVPSSPVLPHLLLVVETTSDSFDERVAMNKAIAHLGRAMKDTGRYENAAGIQHDITRSFGDVEVLGLHSSKSTAERARALKRRLLALSEVATEKRANACA